MSEEKPILSWDVTELAEGQVEFLLSLEENTKIEEELYPDVYEDYDFWQQEWQDLLDNLTSMMNERNPDGNWLIKVEGFGWRGENGVGFISTNSAKELLNKVLPKTDNTFWIFNNEDKKGFKINNCHHDSPVRGKEWYYIIPVNNKED